MKFLEELDPRIFSLALEEDCVDRDITTSLSLASSKMCVGHIVAKSQGVWCGEKIISGVLKAAQDKKLRAINLVNILSDGGSFSAGQTLCELRGFAKEMLALERTILNFVQRSCAVATKAARYVSKAPRLTILDTRKTTPGLRSIERYAVRVGGAKNHRDNLSDRILIKNNHIDLCGMPIGKLLESVMNTAPAGMLVEIEVRDLIELRQAISGARPHWIMLDNFSDDLILRAVDLIRSEAPEVRIEVSGGITEDRLPFLNSVGDIAVSVGALTHSIEACDLSLRLKGAQ